MVHVYTRRISIQDTVLRLASELCDTTTGMIGILALQGGSQRSQQPNIYLNKSTAIHGCDPDTVPQRALDDYSYISLYLRLKVDQIVENLAFPWFCSLS